MNQNRNQNGSQSQSRNANAAASATYGHRASRRKQGPAKVVAIMLGCLVGLLVVVYLGVGIYFNGRFMPNSTAGSLNLSLMTASDAEKAISDATADYALSLSGQGLDVKLTSADLGLDADASAIVDAMLSDMNPWLWPFQIGAQHDESAALAEGANGTGLADAVSAAVSKFNASATQPVNAAISYDSASASFVVLPESVGTALDANAVTQVAAKALSTLSKQAKITADQLAQPAVFSTDARLKAAAESANTMAGTNLTLTMNGTQVGAIDAKTIAPWITSDAEANATLDDAQLSAWVDTVVADCTTVGTKRTYTRPDGKSCSVSGGIYGWEVDRDALLSAVRSAVSAGSTQALEVPTTTHGDAFTGVGSQDWSARYLDIDLSEQHARFYDASGALVWESDVITGIPDGEHDTPEGVYWMNRKESPSTLKGYSGDTQTYETVVQYWMPFVGGAIGLHDADWQTSGFGGTLYKDGLGSHGCVNLPPEKAAELYALVEGGDAVVCHW